MMDPRPQTFNGQQSRQQRHPGEDSMNAFLPSSSAGAFLFPDAQGGFTLSAEPAMIDDGSLASLTPYSGTGQDAAFTPNTASSFDSSLHPDYVSQSYPPPNWQAPQSYTLSPGSHSRNGQSISPSHSVEHFSPEAGYLSDPNYSSYTTPSFNGQYLEEGFQNLNFADQTLNSNNAFDTFPNGLEMSLPMTADALATYNAQPHHLLHSSSARIDSHSHLISPSHTNDSSPIVADDSAGLSHAGNGHHPPSSPTPHATHATPSYSTPNKQQHSPPLTSSPGLLPATTLQPRAHLTSPIVRVENYSRGESPSLSDVSRPVSKRSHGSRRSGNHLSPYPVDDSSSDEDASHEQVQVRPAVRTAERGEDGSWLPNASSGQAGLSPAEREAMQDDWVPTIEELADQRLKEEKKLEVQEWLTKSEVGSEAGDVNPSTSLLRPVVPSRRRAKSTNDAPRQGYGATFGLGVRTDFDRIDDSGIPGPGVYIDERSDYDGYGDDDDDYLEPESPPAEIDISASHADDDVPFTPPAIEHGAVITAVLRPWMDLPAQQPTTSTRYQPQTSNAAMMRFWLRSKDVETASLAATLGSRRLSESDLGSIRAAPGVVKVIEPDPKKQKAQLRRPSFLDNIRRNPSNILKRKGSIPVQPPHEVGTEKSKELVNIERPKRMGSWGRPKSPRLDTSVATHGKDIGPPSSTGLSATSGPWYQGAKNAIKRSRSKSDLGKSFGLAELMTQHGGPPMPMLASPLAETEATKFTPQPSPGGDDDDDDAQDPVQMDLKVRSDPIIPTYEGFKSHARQLNPRLVDYMVERITQEQVRRFKRLQEFKVKHLNAVKNGNCASGDFCPDLGGESKQLPPRAGNKDTDAPFIGFQITAPGSSDDDGEGQPEGTVIAAQFPSGVPLPPVKRLPAEFECPLCFKVKKFYKPSDWTKHVHEDVQPFTCTFPNCGEPKSFKRKADWVRHENERHRQLENWTCQIAECNHVCYRKDNFVQHLVREHKIAEQRARTGRNKDAPATSATDDIWSLVERCRHDTMKQPKDEPCRFCGNICNSWKKLTVHLAKHMEQISMPILPLVEQKQLNADSIISPVVEMPETRKLSTTPSRSPVDNPSRYNPSSTFAPGIDPSFGNFPQDASSSAASSNVMHTYPPPQAMNYKDQQAAQKSNYSAYATENVAGYTGRTYPGIQGQGAGKPRGYLSGLPMQNQPYPNGSIQAGPNRFPVPHVPTIAQQQPMFTTSPVDTPYSADNLGPVYLTQEPQSMGNGGMPDMDYDTRTTMPFNPSAYEEMAYMTTPQQNYQYHG